jgi:hypothetical protein
MIVKHKINLPYYSDPEAMIKYIGKSYGLIPEPKDEKYPQKMFKKARQEHAWLLRSEGLTLQTIGERLGVGREGARGLIFKFGREEMTRAIKRTKWKIENRSSA